MNRHPSPFGPPQRRVVDTGPTQRRVEDTGPTQPPVDPDEVARALGAEPVGPPSGFPGITFAALRARVAALDARRGANAPTGDPFDVGPQLRTALNQLTADLRADGVTTTPREIAAVLLELSVESARADRAALTAKLKERSASGGLPS